MSVAVLRTDGDESDGRVEPSVEPFTLIRRSVMGDLHHVDRCRLAERQQTLLRLLAEVAEVDRADALPFELHRDAPIVASQGGVASARRRGPEDAPAQSAEAARHSG
jgi:hypothetical protein